MVDILRAYNVEGTYMFRGSEGRQSGTFHTCSDGKIVGKMRDLNAGGTQGPEKNILGFRSEDGMEINFMKLPIASAGVYPVLWNMTAKGTDKLDVGALAQNYEGFFVFDNRLESIGMEIIAEISRKKIKDLAAIDYKSLREGCLDDETIEQIKANGRRYNQTGLIHLV